MVRQPAATPGVSTEAYRRDAGHDYRTSRDTGVSPPVWPELHGARMAVQTRSALHAALDLGTAIPRVPRVLLGYEWVRTRYTPKPRNFCSRCNWCRRANLARERLGTVCPSKHFKVHAVPEESAYPSLSETHTALWRWSVWLHRLVFREGRKSGSSPDASKGAEPWRL